MQKIPTKPLIKSMRTAIYTPPCGMFPMTERPTSVCMSAASTATQSRRIASIVPYGYRKSEDNPKQWIIDEPAAQTVKKIYTLRLAGKGPMQIARQLEEEKILSPAAYFESIGRKHAQKVPKNPCGWEQATVGYILENRQYTGCAVNFKSTTVSYKVHKRIQHNEEDYQNHTRHAGSHHLRRTMAEGAGASETQAQTDENRQDEPFFGTALLLRLQMENALYSRQEHETETGAFPLFPI